jgi:poly(3-hydroxybutyrate) depolymerase
MRHPTLVFACVLGAAACTPAANDDDSAPPPSGEALAAQSGALSTANEAGRSGHYYLPARLTGQAIPVVLGFHATGGDGEGFVGSFLAMAEQHGFAIVMPDSRISPTGEFTWEVGTEPDEITPDYSHALACLAEVQNSHGLLIDEQRVLSAGYSGGASSAPYLASNEELFTAFAVLHGGVFAGGIGNHIVPGWFSTGEDDSIRTPAHMQEQLDSLSPLGFDDLVLEIFPGGHGLGEEEVRRVTEWWLAPP